MINDSVTGRQIDLTQMIDASGSSTTALGHLLATPVLTDIRDRALDKKM